MKLDGLRVLPDMAPAGKLKPWPQFYPVRHHCHARNSGAVHSSPAMAGQPKGQDLSSPVKCQGVRRPGCRSLGILLGWHCHPEGESLALPRQKGRAFCLFGALQYRPETRPFSAGRNRKKPPRGKPRQPRAGSLPKHSEGAENRHGHPAHGEGGGRELPSTLWTAKGVSAGYALSAGRNETGAGKRPPLPCPASPRLA